MPVACNIIVLQSDTILYGPLTDSTKINRPGHNIHTYWANFWQQNVHAQQDIFEKTLIEVGCPHLYASFSTFCVQICQFSNILQRLTNLDAKGAKKAQLINMWTKTSIRVFSKISCLSKNWSVQAYVIPQTVYFDSTCNSIWMK